MAVCQAFEAEFCPTPGSDSLANHQQFHNLSFSVRYLLSVETVDIPNPVLFANKTNTDIMWVLFRLDEGRRAACDLPTPPPPRRRNNTHTYKCTRHKKKETDHTHIKTCERADQRERGAGDWRERERDRERLDREVRSLDLHFMNPAR